MKRTPFVLISMLVACTSMPAFSASKTPVVVELFTSQGCSSCPPANANLIKLSGREDVLALSFAVTYWDRLGWKDSFGQEVFTDRQRIYEPALGQRGPFTPQIVVNGATTAVGNDLTEVEQLIDAAKPLGGPMLSLVPDSVAISDGKAPTSGADIWLVRYDPDVVEVRVRRGENTGRTLPHTHVVHDLMRLGTWTGAALSLQVPAARAGLRSAVLVQAMNGGAILAAVTD